MIYCQHEKRQRYNNERKAKEWDENAQGYVDNGLWSHCFKGEATVSDPEQSFLSRYVFAKLMGIDVKTIPANKIKIDNNGFVFHFDLMNNLKDTTFEEKYKYTLGNFAPIPAVKFSYITKKGTKTQAHLQLIHKWKNEKWDGVLGTLKANWKEYVGKSDFAEYMISTCQQLYFQEIFDEFYDPNLDLEKVNWDKKTKEWNKKIRGQKDLKIITFEDINASLPEIEFLIEARGRCILSCLRNS